MPYCTKGDNAVRDVILAGCSRVSFPYLGP